MPTQFSFGLVGIGAQGGVIPAMINGTQTSETKTASGSSSPTTATAPAGDNSSRVPMARVSTTVDVYVSFGASPNATSDTNRIMVPAGGVEYVFVKTGDKGDAVTV